MLAKPIITLGRFAIDWKGLGYLTSIVSVLFLGAVAWPKAGEPGWHAPALIIGMAASIIGMGFRYRAHLQEQREIGGPKPRRSAAKDGLRFLRSRARNPRQRSSARASSY